MNDESVELIDKHRKHSISPSLMQSSTREQLEMRKGKMGHRLSKQARGSTSYDRFNKTILNSATPVNLSLT